MANKRKNQRRHAQVRAEQRFGLGMSQVQYEALCLRIKNGYVKDDKGIVVLEKQSIRVVIMAIFYKNEWLPIVWDKNRKAISTFLPREALNPYLKKLENINGPMEELK